MLLSLFYEENNLSVFFEGAISMVVDRDGWFLRWLIEDGYSLIILDESYIRINIIYSL